MNGREKCRGNGNGNGNSNNNKRRMYGSALLFVSSIQKYIRIGTVADLDGNVNVNSNVSVMVRVMLMLMLMLRIMLTLTIMLMAMFTLRVSNKVVTKQSGACKRRDKTHNGE